MKTIKKQIQQEIAFFKLVKYYPSTNSYKKYVDRICIPTIKDYLHLPHFLDDFNKGMCHVYEYDEELCNQITTKYAEHLIPFLLDNMDDVEFLKRHLLPKSDGSPVTFTYQMLLPYQNEIGKILHLCRNKFRCVLILDKIGFDVERFQTLDDD